MLLKLPMPAYTKTMGFSDDVVVLIVSIIPRRSHADGKPSLKLANNKAEAVLVTTCRPVHEGVVHLFFHCPPFPGELATL